MNDNATETSEVGAVTPWFGLVMLVGVLAIAASTDSLDVWRTRDAIDRRLPPSPVVDDTIVPAIRQPVDSGVSLIGIAIVLLVVLGVLILLRSTLRQPPFVDLAKRLFGWGRLAEALQDPLPETTMHEVGADISDARNALLGGDARNGIVACWMRLERGALDVGLPRWAAETADEYSRRVVTSTSVDPAPLDELADLYREARFSSHRLSEHHRDRASIALGRISDRLAVDGSAAL